MVWATAVVESGRNVRMTASKDQKGRMTCNTKKRLSQGSAGTATTEGSVLDVALVGYGQFGRLHAQKYHSLSGCRLVSVVDSDPHRRALAADEYPGVKTYASVDALVEDSPPDLASVVVPAALHYPVAKSLLNAGVHALIEKPLAAEITQAKALLKLAHKKNLVLQPGHLERFNHTLTELQECLPHWRYLEARRMSCWSTRGGDVDVVMDLMIHDIDLLLAMTDQAVIDIQARGVKVFSPHWDVANARLTFADGRTANLTASRASLQSERRFHVFGESACALVNINNGEMLLYRLDNQGLHSEQHFCRHEDPLAAEIAAFVQAVQASQTPLVSAADGCRAVAIAQRIGQAMEQDQELLDRIAMPMPDYQQAIAYLQEAVH